MPGQPETAWGSLIVAASCVHHDGVAERNGASFRVLLVVINPTAEFGSYRGVDICIMCELWFWAPLPSIRIPLLSAEGILHPIQLVTDFVCQAPSTSLGNLLFASCACMLFCIKQELTHSMFRFGLSFANHVCNMIVHEEEAL